MSSDKSPATASVSATIRPFKLIGELMNNAFARARQAWISRDIEAYQHLASLQTKLGADYLTLNLDSTQGLHVEFNDMIDFLPTLIPAIQQVTDVPLSFDNPAVAFHDTCLPLYDRALGCRPVVNSVAASRQDLDEIYALIKRYDTKVIVMASEKVSGEGYAQCDSGEEMYLAARYFIEQLHDKSNRSNKHIIIDPGLAPIAADTYGLINMSLDAMRLIRADKDMDGVLISVGLTNFSYGVPKSIREGLENAFITLAMDAGLDMVLGNPEKDLKLLPADDRFVNVVREALELGRPGDDETQQTAGFRQSEKILDLYY